MTDYTKIFDPPLVPPAPPAAVAGSTEQVGDRAAAIGYVYDEELVLAVNVALATGRPLLLRGRPGTGKSSVARNVALHLKRRFYPRTITSRTQARDLLWTVDDVSRLSDATAKDQRVGERSDYVEPGVLWWAFAPGSATRENITDPNEGEPNAAEAVVLLDEIDKADPDVPNDLLEPLGLYWFRDIRGDVVKAGAAPLIILTTNEERDLPKAFLRRCVSHTLPLPTRGKLRQIAEVRFGPDASGLYDEVVQMLAPAEESAPEAGVDVSIAEFLDAVSAARQLGIRPGNPRWDMLLAATTAKSVKPHGAI